MAESIGFTYDELQGKRMWSKEEMSLLKKYLREGKSKAEAVDLVINPREASVPPGMP